MTELCTTANARRQDLLGALLEGDRTTSRVVLDGALLSGASRCAVFAEVVAPCLREIGDLWQRGELTVPEEHLASKILMGVLNELRLDVPSSGPTAVVSCAPLERHVLPAVLARELLTDMGWRVWFLGASAPAADLVEFTRRRRPRLLVLTATLARSVTGVAAVTGAMRTDPGRPAVMVGGAGILGVGRPEAVGADALGRDFSDLVGFAAELAAGG